MSNSYPLTPKDVIQIAHERVHQGVFYSTFGLSAGIANGANFDFLLQVGSNKFKHSVFSFSAGGDATVSLYSGVSFSAVGTTVIPINHNRISSNLADGISSVGPTIATTPTLLAQAFFPGGTKNQATGSGGAIGFDSEWILNKSTNYLLRVTNNAGSAQTISVVHSFYEV